MRPPIFYSSPAGKPAWAEGKLLSWGFPKILSTSISVPRPHHLSMIPDGCPSFVAKLPHSARDPPLPFLPASTVCSVRPLAGLLHPATGPEVRSISVLWRRAFFPRASPRRGARPLRSSLVAPCSRTPFRAFPLSFAVPRHRGPCPLTVLTDLRAFLVRQVRCRVLVLPPGRTRCSPGLRSPSGFSPLAQPACGVLEQDPLVPGRDHHWCFRAWRT